MRVLAAHQPNYIPYLGFLHKASRADVFVLQDDLKYVKNDYGNRNRIQAEDEWRWLSIPVKANNESTFETVIPAEATWPREHANILRSKYHRAAHRDRLEPYLETMAANANEALSVIAIALARQLFAEFGVETPTIVESELHPDAFDNPNDRLISLCQRYDCDAYLSGVGARAYIEVDRWSDAGIELRWSDYEPIAYQRGSAPWIPNLSSLDALAHADDPASLLR